MAPRDLGHGQDGCRLRQARAGDVTWSSRGSSGCFRRIRLVVYIKSNQVSQNLATGRQTEPTETANERSKRASPALTGRGGQRDGDRLALRPRRRDTDGEIHTWESSTWGTERREYRLNPSPAQPSCVLRSDLQFNGGTGRARGTFF